MWCLTKISQSLRVHINTGLQDVIHLARNLSNSRSHALVNFYISLSTHNITIDKRPPYSSDFNQGMSGLGPGLVLCGLANTLASNQNPCVNYHWCNNSGTSRTTLKVHNHSRAKCTAVYLTWLDTDTINKATGINEFCKRLSTCISAGGREFEHMIMIWT